MNQPKLTPSACNGQTLPKRCAERPAENSIDRWDHLIYFIKATTDMLVESALEISEDFTSMDNVDEILLDSFLDFDFDFSEEFCAINRKFTSNPNTTQSLLSDTLSVFLCIAGKRKVSVCTEESTQTVVSLTRGSSASPQSLSSELNHARKKTRKSSERIIEEQQIEYYTKPIYAFLTFDKSDALIYLPNTLSRYMNTGDVPALSKLLLSHCDKKCVVDVPKFSSEINVRKLVQIFDKMFDIHPDCVAVACAHQTKVVGNQISSSLFLKLTDIKIIQDVIRPSLHDPVLHEIFGGTRQQRMQRQLVCAQSLEEERQIRTLGQTDNDILIHVHVKLVLTIDEITKKVCKFGVQWKSTSMVEINKSI